MQVSAIIPTKNRYSDLVACVRSLLFQTMKPDEIIVVDASDTGGLEEVLDTTFGNNPVIRYIHSRPGLTLQRNIGVQAAGGDILLFFDDDVVLEKNFVAEISRVFESDTGKLIGGVYGNIVPSFESGEEKKCAGGKSSLLLFAYSLFASVFFLSKVRKDGKFQPTGFPTYPYGSDVITTVECVPGGLTGYRREVFQEFSFDENLTGYGYMEDDDFSYRVSRKYKNVYTPHARVIHNESPAARDRRYASRKMMIMNYYYLFVKNIPQDFFHRAVFWWSVLGLFTNEIITLNYSGIQGLKDGLNLRGKPYR
nr:glycosyltransferase family 2 protein [uncultured Methanoregula sp.]